MRKIPTKPKDLSRFSATIQEAAQKLGSGFSISTIKRRINQGVWVEGTHWANISVGKNRQVRINLEAIRDRSSWGD